MPGLTDEEIEKLEADVGLSDEEITSLETSDGEMRPEMGFKPDSVLQTGKGEAFGRGLAQGASLGSEDELGPFVEKGVARLSRATGIGPQDVAQRVIEAPRKRLVAENRQELAEVEAAHPEVFGAGKTVGMVAPAAATFMLGPITQGAALGGAAGAGEAPEGQKFLKGVIGAARGAAGGVVAGKLAPRAGDAKDALAAGNMSRRLGFRGQHIKKAGGVEKATDVAQTLREAGIGRKGMNLKSLAEEVDELENVVGEQIGNAYKALPKEPTHVLRDIIKEIDESFRNVEALYPEMHKSILDNAGKIVRDLIHRKGTLSAKLTPQDLWEFKQVLGKKGWEKGIIEQSALEPYQRAWKIVADALDEATDLVDPLISQQLWWLNKTYNAAIQGGKALGDKLISLSGRKAPGLLGLADRTALDVTNYAVSSGVEKTARALSGVQKVLERIPESLGKFKGPLEAAAQRGPGALNAMWYVMSQQHPELLELTKEVESRIEEEDGAGNP